MIWTKLAVRSCHPTFAASGEIFGDTYGAPVRDHIRSPTLVHVRIVHLDSWQARAARRSTRPIVFLLTALGVDACVAQTCTKNSSMPCTQRALHREILRRVRAERETWAKGLTSGAYLPELERGVGFCEETSSGASDCAFDNKGSWSGPRARSLKSCALACMQCVRCEYVSYSQVSADCSWFAACDTNELKTWPHQPEANGWSYVTLPVRPIADLYIQGTLPSKAEQEQWLKQLEASTDEVLARVRTTRAVRPRPEEVIGAGG